MSMQEVLQMMRNPQFKMLMNCKTPQQAVQIMMNNNPNLQNNEMFRNVIQMMNNGDTKGIETMGRNLAQSQGINPDELLNTLSKGN